MSLLIFIWSNINEQYFLVMTESQWDIWGVHCAIMYNEVHTFLLSSLQPTQRSMFYRALIFKARNISPENFWLESGLASHKTEWGDCLTQQTLSIMRLQQVLELFTLLLWYFYNGEWKGLLVEHCVHCSKIIWLALSTVYLDLVE